MRKLIISSIALLISAAAVAAHESRQDGAQTHSVYLAVMMMPNGIPRQMSAERSMESCLAIINKQAAGETGNNRHTWYCQPAITLGPQ